MKQLEWNSTYITNIQEIDIQHKKLFELINMLHDSIMEKTQTDAIAQIIPELIRYTNYHFSTEEEYMVEHNYPKYALHKAAHQSFIISVNNYVKEIIDGRAALSIKLLTFLSDWLIEHIGQVDKELADFLDKQGVA